MVVVLVAVLAGVAFPPLSHFIRRQELKTAQFDYIAALRFARAAAIEKNVRTLFCPSIDGRHCGNYTDWDRGWLLARDRDRDGQPDDTPLRIGQVATHVIILGSSGRKRVYFRPDGMAPGSNLSLLFCAHGNPGQALKVVVANSGRVRGSAATPAEARACAASTPD